MNRTLSPLKLSKSPLVLVLGQVRIAAVRSMGDYIPKIQDTLRRRGYPVDVSGVYSRVVITPGQQQLRSEPHWEFRKRDERCSIIVNEEFVVVQTTAYTVFEDFLKEIELAVDTVASIVGDLVVERVGLRYVDLIRPADGGDWREYVKPGFHGVKTEAFSADTVEGFFQLTARTEVGKMIARLAQNRDGIALPPDLTPHQPKGIPDVPKGKLLTLLDLDHFKVNRFDYAKDQLLQVAWELHDSLDILFRDMVTEHALTTWR